MDRTERLYKIDGLLRARGAVSQREFLEELGVSKATFNRDLEYLRERLYAPITYDYGRRGYCFTDPDPNAPRYELPGLWFNSRETHALLAFQHFLEHLEPGLLTPHIAPLKERLHALLEKGDRSLANIERRIRVLPLAARAHAPAAFATLAHAVLERKRLEFRYHGRGRGETSDRAVSPQRLVHYRDNWYLDVWDHGKRALRTFAVERTHNPRLLDARAKDISEEHLNRYFTESYGIFSGKPKRKALLRFTPERARWVADEVWHPRQKGWTRDGYYFLEIPYSDDRELVLDILKHGADVEVLKPKSLRDRVLEQLVRAGRQYQRQAPQPHRMSH